MDLPELDITSPESVERAVERLRPGVIVNAAALTDVDYCQLNRKEALRVNRDGVGNLTGTGVRLITISTDHVYTRADCPIPEGTPESPANVYGESKLQGEREALKNPENAVVRTSWLFGRDRGIPAMLRHGLERGGSVRAIKDQTACITYVCHLVQAVVQILDSGACGIFHCVNSGATTPYELATIVRDHLGRGRIEPVTWADLGLPAPRPFYSALCTGRPVRLPPREEALREWLQE